MTDHDIKALLTTRADSLERPPKRTKPVVTPAVEDHTPDDDVDTGRPVAEPRKRATSTKAARPATTSAPANRNLAVHMPPSLAASLTARRKADGSKNGLIVLDAIDALVDHDSPDPLARLKEAIQNDLVAAPPTSLFDRPPTRARIESAGPTSTVQLRMSEDNRAVLDRLVDDTGATDRSQLVTVAVRHYLAASSD